MNARAGGPLLVVLLLLLGLIACGSNDPTATPEPTVASVPVASAGGGTAVAAASAAPSAAPSAAGSSAAPAAGAAVLPATPQSSAGAAAAASAPAAAATPTVASAVRYTIVPDKSSASYKVGEVFLNQGNQYNQAVGTTSDITGDITIDKTKPSASKIGTIKVDISKLQSDSGRRDDDIRDNWLESRKFPIATFVPKRLEGLPDAPYTDGQELTFKIIGDMTIRTVTKEVTFDARATVNGDTLSATATLNFNMTDFGFDPPSILFFLRAENAVELTVIIEAQRAK